MKRFLIHFGLILFLACPALPAASTAPAEKDEAAEALLAGRALIRSGRYFEAMDRLESASLLAQQSGRHLTAALALSNMAEIQRLHGKRAEAARYYAEALRNYRAIDHQDGISVSEKKIAELMGTAALPKYPEAGRDTRIDEAVERVRDRLKANPRGSE